MVDFWPIVSSTKYLHCFKHIPLIFSFSFITDCPCSQKPVSTIASVGNSGANGNPTTTQPTELTADTAGKLLSSQFVPEHVKSAVKSTVKLLSSDFQSHTD